MCERCKQAKLDLQSAMTAREEAAQNHRHPPLSEDGGKNELDKYAERLLDRAFEEYTDLCVSGRTMTRDLALNHVAARCDANLNTSFDRMANEKYGAIAPAVPLERLVRETQVSKESLFCSNEALQRRLHDTEQALADSQRNVDALRSQLAREERHRDRRRARGIESDDDSSDRATKRPLVVVNVGDVASAVAAVNGLI